MHIINRFAFILAGILFIVAGAMEAKAVECVWGGGGSDNNASTPANWVQAIMPTQSADRVRLNETSIKDMTWNLTNSVAGWTQTTNYTGTVTIGTRYDATFPILTISGDCQILGGNWTHTANGAAETYRLRASIGGDLTIGTNTFLDVSGKGYGQGQGPGAGSSQYQGFYRIGASHGGLAGSIGNYWTTYGSVTSPTNLGSGGTLSGGGAIDLQVTGTTILQGTMRAICPYGWPAGGAGGSIRLITGSLNGNGVIDASAGEEGGTPGTGGGRIAVILTGSSSFGDIAMKAYGGGVPRGGAGTIYKETSAQSGGHGSLVIDNHGLSSSVSTLMPSGGIDLDTLASVIITNSGVLGLNTNTLFNLGVGANLVTYGPNQSFISILTTNLLQLPATWTLSNYTLRSPANLYFGGNLTVSNGTLETASWDEPNLHVVGDLLIGQNGTLSHRANDTVEAYRLALRVDGNLDISAGGIIDVTGKGYGRGQGPGAASMPVNNSFTVGASHGGLAGGMGTSWFTYGSITSPTNLGSGGNYAGGGAISVAVGGTTTLQGTMSSKSINQWPGAGAGGSIKLITGSLSGNGVIDASADGNNAGAGGGRIAVILTGSSSFGAITMQVYGSISPRGAAGTIYKETSLQGVNRGTLVIDGNAAPGATNVATTIPAMTSTSASDLTSLKYITLVATNYANVSLLTNVTMGNLYLGDDNAILYLNGYTLTLKAIYHADWGTTNRVVYAGGEIIWDVGQGTIFSIR